MKSITSELHNTSASNEFIKKILFVDVIPKFSIVKGQLINDYMNDGEFINYKSSKGPKLLFDPPSYSRH